MSKHWFTWYTLFVSILPQGLILLILSRLGIIQQQGKEKQNNIQSETRLITSFRLFCCCCCCYCYCYCGLHFCCSPQGWPGRNIFWYGRGPVSPLWRGRIRLWEEGRRIISSLQIVFHQYQIPITITDNNIRENIGIGIFVWPQI